MKPRPKVPAPLFALPPADEATLTVRQRAALLILRQHETGLTAHDLGREHHEHFGVHLDGRPDCTYCTKNGAALAQALKAKGLVQQRKAGVFVAGRASGDAPGHEDPSYDPATSPWPEGFGDAA